MVQANILRKVLRDRRLFFFLVNSGPEEQASVLLAFVGIPGLTDD